VETGSGTGTIHSEQFDFDLVVGHTAVKPRDCLRGAVAVKRDDLAAAAIKGRLPLAVGIVPRRAAVARGGTAERDVASTIEVVATVAHGISASGVKSHRQDRAVGRVVVEVDRERVAVGDRHGGTVVPIPASSKRMPSTAFLVSAARSGVATWSAS
jgi:hypothetical protein